MRTILVFVAIAGISNVAAHAEQQNRPEGGRPHPEGKGDFRPEGRDKKGFDGKEGRERPRPPAAPFEMFKRMDKDHDGKITRAEFFETQRFEQIPEEKRNMMFVRLDRNSDQVIDRQEIHEMHKDAERMAKDRFRGLDQDKSGGLSFEEFSKGELFAKLPEERRKQIFARMDTDGSGEINAEDRPKGPPIERR